MSSELHSKDFNLTRLLTQLETQRYVIVLNLTLNILENTTKYSESFFEYSGKYNKIFQSFGVLF